MKNAELGVKKAPPIFWPGLFLLSLVCEPGLGVPEQPVEGIQNSFLVLKVILLLLR